MVIYDRFDIAEAWFLALEHWHDGQWSREYRRLSKMVRYFMPRTGLSVNTLTPNGREIYDAAVARICKRYGLEPLPYDDTM